MRQLTPLFLFLFTAFSLSAQPVSPSEATKVASHFFQNRGKHFLEISHITHNDSDTLLYICNAENGFVVISGDKCVTPILAYSDCQPYHTEDVIPPVAMWIEHYAQQIQEVKKQHTGSSSHEAEWDQMLNGRGMRAGQEVKPLVKSNWGQGEFYNYYCPRDYSGENNRVVTGCVATAMAQLIYYFRFPETGTGSYSYLDSTYGIQSADYGNTIYDYSAMCDKPARINDAISTLMHHCGVGVDMVYGPDGSGMYNHSAARVLKTFFKYSPETQYVFRDSTQLNWDSLIVSHLDRKIPLYYAGWSVPNINGHGFLCDGYQMTDTNYFYHFNFGWDGSYDGYFYTNALSLIGTHFNLAQELIVNAYPDTNLYPYPLPQPLIGIDTLTTIAGSFTNLNILEEATRPGMDHTWIIRPNVTNLNSISLSILYDLGEDDTLQISSDNNPLQIFTHDSSSLNINWNCSELIIRYKSGHINNGRGIRGNYSSNWDELCQNYTSYSGNSGSVSDGSEEENYASFTNCRFNIVLTKKQVALLHFTHFDLEEGHDYLYIFNNAYSNANLITSLTGFKSDTTIRIDDIRRIFFLFESDAYHNASGFDFDYYTSETSVNDLSVDQDLAIMPNPASSSILITCPEQMRSLEIRDMLGHVVQKVDVQDHQVHLSVENLTSGVYLIRIQTETNTITKKFIKQ